MWAVLNVPRRWFALALLRLPASMYCSRCSSFERSRRVPCRPRGWANSGVEKLRVCYMFLLGVFAEERDAGSGRGARTVTVRYAGVLGRSGCFLGSAEDVRQFSGSPGEPGSPGPETVRSLVRRTAGDVRSPRAGYVPLCCRERPNVDDVDPSSRVLR